MTKYLVLILMICLIGCTETKPKKGLVASVAKTEEQIKSENEIKRKTKKERMELVEVGKMTPLGKLIDQDSVIVTTDDFKGKLLVIDFWATWCSPCLKEAPKFKALEAKYENEKVAFITISVDDEFAYWKKFVKENNWKTDNYWFGMNKNDAFFSHLYSKAEIDNKSMILIGLPKYIIIAPNGKILNNQAPKPSNPDFEKELIKLIEAYAT